MAVEQLVFELGQLERLSRSGLVGHGKADFLFGCQVGMEAGMKVEEAVDGR